MLHYNKKVRKKIILILFIFITLMCSTCKEKKFNKEETIVTSNKEKGGNEMAIKITSSAFVEGKMIPRKYCCDGEGISPPLKWENIPENAKSLVLISDDPDAPAGTWVHWVVYDILPNINEFPEDILSVDLLEDLEEFNLSGKQGVNSGRSIGYQPPCPPSGTHRYFFKIYALDTILNLDAGASKKEVIRAMERHIISEGKLMGRYRR